MTTRLRHLLRTRLIMACWILLLFFTASLQAEPINLNGHWLQLPDGWSYSNPDRLHLEELHPVDQLSRTGGRYLYLADFDVTHNDPVVLDFKNSSVIGLFHHRIFNTQGQLVADAEGGIQNDLEPRFFLRHGREFDLPPGHYHLLTEISSPFYLAQPEPYLDSLEHYRHAINLGNALTLICTGIMLSMAFYYGVLSLTRRSQVYAMYTLFALGNLSYNSSALLLSPQLLGLHNFYLISFPFLFTNNWAYVFFVMGLMGINRDTQPLLFKIGLALAVVAVSFIVIAFFKPNWSLEFDRYAVGMYLSYGLACGIISARRKHPLARAYLFAIGIFFVLGMTSISLGQMHGTNTFYVEHLGMLAITAEIMLLSFVLAKQFALLHEEKEQALALSLKNLHAASTDSLTGLPNRFALVQNLHALPAHGCLTFIDLDGLKYYNDHFGHEKGDELLCKFGELLQQKLPSHALVHRLGGDEFAITCPHEDTSRIDRALQETQIELRNCGFELAGASHGTVHVREAQTHTELMRLADTRMYACKHSNKQQHDLPLSPAPARPHFTVPGNLSPNKA